jgi:hypothetical protein
VRLDKIHQLRIRLQGVEPAVWRSVRVPAAVTLAKLHKVFQVVMGWSDSHLHIGSCLRDSPRLYRLNLRSAPLLRLPQVIGDLHPQPRFR